MRRIVTVTGILAISLLATTAPALADGWGTTNCSQVPSPACDLGAGKGGGDGKPGGNSGNSNSNPGRPGSTHSGNGNSDPNPGDTIIGGNSNLASCSYVKSDYQPPAGGVQTAAYTRPTNSGGMTVQLAAFTRAAADAGLTTRAAAAPTPGQSGAWYVWTCTTAGVTDGLYHPPVFIPNGQQAPGAAPLPSPAQMAQMAFNQLRLPTPSIATNPAGEQLVNLPTWMWLSSGWGPVSATASVPGVSVTATATATSVTWSMGDGSTVTCTGAGTPFHPGTAPTASSPDCGHTYRTSSASQAGQAFPVAATVHWTVTWAGAGQGGVFPDLTTTGNAAFRVAESQALNNGG
jgi:hypothetical protein